MSEYASGDESWVHEAACKGLTELFYAPRHEVKRDRVMREEIARQVCASCVVRSECLSYAVEHNEQHGIWAGLNEAELRAFRRQGRLNETA